MKPSSYIHLFAGISIIALSLQIVSDFWLPVVIGAAAMLFTAAVLRR